MFAIAFSFVLAASPSPPRSPSPPVDVAVRIEELPFVSDAGAGDSKLAATARWRAMLNAYPGTLRIDDELTIRRIAKDTFVVVHEVPHPANSLVAQMPDGTTVFVGSPYDPASTTKVIEWVKKYFAPTALVAIDGHFHFDGGPGGHEAYARAGAKVYGSDLTAKLLRERADALRAGMVESLSDEPALQARFKTFTLKPPEHEFPLAQGLTLHFGGEEVQVRFPGPAHAPDNVVVWFPSRQLLFGGCAVVAMPKMGYLGDANLDTWPAALEVMRKFRPRLVIPGHAQPGGAQLLDHTLELVKEAAKAKAVRKR